MEIKLQTERNIDPNKPMVALTFDNGPSPTNTPEILEVLKENDARATFFVLGAQAEQYPEINRSQRAEVRWEATLTAIWI